MGRPSCADSGWATGVDVETLFGLSTRRALPSLSIPVFLGVDGDPAGLQAPPQVGPPGHLPSAPDPLADHDLGLPRPRTRAGSPLHGSSVTEAAPEKQPGGRGGCRAQSSRPAPLCTLMCPAAPTLPAHLPSSCRGSMTQARPTESLATGLAAVPGPPSSPAVPATHLAGFPGARLPS